MVKFFTAQTFLALSEPLWSIVIKSTVATLVLELGRAAFLPVLTWLWTFLFLSDVIEDGACSPAGHLGFDLVMCTAHPDNVCGS